MTTIDYTGTEITLNLSRDAIDPQGEMSDEAFESAADFIIDAIKTAFPGARIRQTHVTGGRLADGTDISQEVSDVSEQAWESWCSQADEEPSSDGAPSHETTITRLSRADARGLRLETSETITTTYAELAPIRGEAREWSALDADDRAWWADWLTRYHAACVTLAERDEDEREAAWEAYHAAGGDADDALAALERAVAAMTAEDE